jgi:hypothetical protein
MAAEALLKTPSPRRFACGALILLTLLVTAIPAARHAWKGETGDFTHLRQAARAMVEGEHIYASGSGYYIYPPLTAFIFQPLALVSEKGAAIIWLVFNVFLTFTATLIASKEAAARWRLRESGEDLSMMWLIAALATVLTADKIRSIFGLGQTDCLMLLGFTLVRRWMDRKPACAGIAAGAAANLKYLTLVFVPYFLIKAKLSGRC